MLIKRLRAVFLSFHKLKDIYEKGSGLFMRVLKVVFLPSL